jgi:poly-beta-hydroxyalkanoate depolymerase
MSWRIFRRDVTRLIRVRKTWIIVIGVLITPAAIDRTALLAIEGERDDISGLGQTKAALDLATSLFLPGDLVTKRLDAEIGSLLTQNFRHMRRAHDRHFAALLVRRRYTAELGDQR